MPDEFAQNYLAALITRLKNQRHFPVVMEVGSMTHYFTESIYKDMATEPSFKFPTVEGLASI